MVAIISKNTRTLPDFTATVETDPASAHEWGRSILSTWGESGCMFWEMSEDAGVFTLLGWKVRPADYGLAQPGEAVAYCVFCEKDHPGGATCMGHYP